MQAAGGSIVGRGSERAELAGALDAAARGRGRAVMVYGEAGIGKSTLVDWLVDAAASLGFRVGRGYCSRLGALPLWPWRRAFRTLGLGDVGRDLGPAAGGPVPDSTERVLLASAVVEALTTAAFEQQPILLVIEDLHWADPPSLQLAYAVAEAAPGNPLLIMFSWRDDPGDTDGAGDDLDRALPTSVRRLPVGPLTVDEVAALAEPLLERTLSDSAAHELHRRTGGNPFFVNELARLAAAQTPGGPIVVPRGVQAVLRRRVARLSQRCAEVLRLAAVAAGTAGDDIETELLVRAADRDRTDIVRLLDEAVTSRLLDSRGQRYRFRHSLIREVLEQDLTISERRRTHERVARALESGPDLSAARLAHHWLQAGSADARAQATHWSLAAGREAMNAFGFEAAAEHYAHALDDPAVDRIAIRVGYGEALHQAGEVVKARTALISAGREAAAVNRPIELARAALALGGGVAGFEVAPVDEMQTDLLLQADATLPADEVAYRAAVRARLSIAVAGSRPVAERVRLAEDAVRLGGVSGDRSIESSALAAYCDAVAGPDHVASRMAAARRMLDLVHRPGRAGLSELTAVLLAYRLLLVGCLESGDLAGAWDAAAGYETTAAKVPVARYSWLPLVWRGTRALLNGQPDLALEHAAAVEEIALRAGSLNGELMAFTLRMQAYLDLGTPQEYAENTRRQLDRLLPAVPVMYAAGPARLLLAAGNADLARSVLQAFVAGSEATMPKDAEWLECHWAMADLALHLDDHRAASGLFTALRPYEALWAVDGIGGAVFGNVAEQLGRLAAFLGRPDEAATHLAAARARYHAQGTLALSARMDATADQGPADDGPGRLRREGQVWLIEWRGRRSAIPDAKGLHDLAVLLSRPGDWVSALDLVEAAGGPSARVAGSDLGPVLDAQARAAYRARLTELDRDIEDAEADADLGRLDPLRHERALLVEELTAAFGLGGRLRIAGDPAERARKAVTMRIRAAIGAIESQDPALARHLRNAVRTGRFCSYQPEDHRRWQT